MNLLQCKMEGVSSSFCIQAPFHYHADHSVCRQSGMVVDLLHPCLASGQGSQSFSCIQQELMFCAVVEQPSLPTPELTSESRLVDKQLHPK